MTRFGVGGYWLLALLVAVGGCATRPVNPPITQVDADKGYTFQTRQKHFKSQENLVVLAFSGGGTRAAAFSYGVLEFLRRTEVTTPKGKGRLLDAVDVITGGVAAQSPPAAKAAAPAQAAKPAKKSAQPAFKMVLEPRAMELLKATSVRLAAAKSMSFTATVNYECPSQLGPPIAYTMRT